MTRSGLCSPASLISSRVVRSSSRTESNIGVFSRSWGGTGPGSGCPVEDDLAAAAAGRFVEGGVEVLVGVAAGDHRGQIEAAFEEDGHRVPGLEHLAAVDPLDGDHGGD